MVETKIIVGVDGSPGSLAAPRVALEEARVHRAPLRVVMAWQLTWASRPASSNTAGVSGTLVGSVAHAVIHHARCPVLVVPRSADGTDRE